MSYQVGECANPSSITHEFFDLEVREAAEAEYISYYESFGWEVASKTDGLRTPHRTLVILRRKRRIKNRAKLLELQSGFQTALENVQRFEHRIFVRSLLVAGAICAAGLGGLFAGLMHSRLDQYAMAVVCCAAGIVALALVRRSYRLAQRSQLARANPQLERHLYTIRTYCQQASILFS